MHVGVCVVGVGAVVGIAGGGVLPAPREAGEAEEGVGIETGTETEGGEGGGRQREMTGGEAEREGGPDLQG